MGIGDKCKCLRCGHEWHKRIDEDPKRCPNCKNELWNKPYKRYQVGHMKVQQGGGE
jgi:predicted Zn-ribbon and HTH transcriptional regulator